ncbi:MAG: TonB-dependent receptor [Paludibacteraceae bacterium]|nr:TonB-dependent receptor [Paludibacteraceae bacterium]
MKNRLVTSLTFLHIVAAASAASLKGVVVSAEDGAPLPGASITIKELPNEGMEALEDGTFKLEVPSGKYTVVCEMVGYSTLTKTVNVKNDAKLNFKLDSDVEDLGAVEVTSRSTHKAIEQTQMSVAHLEVSDMKKMPSMFGEQDVIKSLQLMPGVKAESDASSGFQVRGGESSQNLVLLDGATVNNAGHLMGLFSTFNSDVLRDVTLYKGQMPAQYGGRIASVLDVATANGNNEHFQADGAIGLLASKLTLHGPFQKGKSSWLVAGRRTYIDLFLKGTEDFKDTKLNFYDINAKLDFKLSQKDQLDVTFFNGQDQLGINDLMAMKWGSTIGALKWRHAVHSGLAVNTQAFVSHYKTTNWMELDDSDYSYDGVNTQASLRENLTWNVGEKHTLDFGFQSSYLDVVSAEWEFNDVHEKEERFAWENHFWINDEWNINKRLSLLAGVRLSVFSLLGSGPYYEIDGDGNIVSTTNYGKGDFVKTYVNPEPRLSANYKLTNNQSLKAAYSHTCQNLHTIKNGITSLPMDRFTLSSNLLKPETADQVSAGYAISFDNESHNNAYEVAVDVYYKHTDNIIDYRDGVGSMDEIEIDRLVLAGQGRSYGIELEVKKNFGKVTGWVSYTLSRTESQIDGINRDRWYTANNDRRHDINVVAIYTPNKRWDFSASWKYYSGQAMSLPVGKYQVENQTYYYYDNRNNYRAPSYHRLDLGATRHGRPHKHWQSELAFGLYNAYGRYNPFIISVREDPYVNSGSKATLTAMYSFLPSFTYRFKFK